MLPTSGFFMPKKNPEFNKFGILDTIYLVFIYFNEVLICFELELLRLALLDYLLPHLSNRRC
jgi:hypothetical protein